MQVVLNSFKTLIPRRGEFHFNWQMFVRENITSSWLLTLWLIIITLITVNYTIGQLQVVPVTTIVVLVLWGVTVLMTVMAELQKHHTSLTLWLKNNLYNSITNVEISLLLVLLILAAIRGFYSYAWVNASFETEPIARAEYETTIEEVAAAGGPDLSRLPANLPFTSPAQSLTNPAGTTIRETTYILNDDKSVVTVVTEDVYTGATWGAVIDNFANLMVFRFKEANLIWRVYAALAFLAVFGAISFYVYRNERFRRSRVRTLFTFLWLLSPFLIYWFLLGFSDTQGSMWARINPDITLGGFLFSVIIAIFAIVLSFPLGVLLALGRRSTVRGIPWWITYPAAAVITIWGLAFSTPTLLETSNNLFGAVTAYWPLAVPVIAYAFQRTWNGNVVAAFSTIFIEVWRGVPFITVLFMSIILFPIFLPTDVTILNTTRVLVGSALFSAAYLAENVRGGLQAIPRGQYEAADSLGIGTYNKYRLIILPQALRLVIPAIVGQFIGLFKDTSLVYLVGLFDLLAVANAISSQPDWLGIRTEPYIFLLVLYFICSSAMAWYSRRLERQLGVGER